MDYVDPEDRSPLHLADPSELRALQQDIEAAKAKRADGADVPAFDSAYLTEDGSRAYLVIDGIPNFLVTERVERETAQ